MQVVKPVYTYKDAFKDQEWLADHSIEFHQKYRGEWVAIYFKEIVAHDQDFDKVVTKADEMGITPAYMQFPMEETVVYAIG